MANENNMSKKNGVAEEAGIAKIFDVSARVQRNSIANEAEKAAFRQNGYRNLFRRSGEALADYFDIDKKMLGDFNNRDGKSHVELVDKSVEQLYFKRNITREEVLGAANFALMDVDEETTIAFKIFGDFDVGAKILKNDPLTAAKIVGYTAGVIFHNCCGTKTKDIDQVLAMFDEKFDEETEITDKKWIIPITGSLYDDLRANFVAKQILKMNDYAKTNVVVAYMMGSVLKDQYFRWIEGGMTTRFTFPYDLQMDDEGIVAFIHSFETKTAEASSLVKSCAKPVNDAVKKVLYRQMRLGATGAVNLTALDYAAAITSVSSLFAEVDNGVVCNKMVAPDKAPQEFNYITAWSYEKTLDSLDKLLSDRENGHYGDPAEFIDTMEALTDFDFRNSMDELYRAYMFDRERLELSRRKAQIFEENKKKKKGVYVRTCDYERMAKAQEDYEAQKAELDKLKQTSKEKDRSETSKISAQQAHIQKVEKDLQHAREKAEIAERQLEDTVKQVEILQKMMEELMETPLDKEEPTDEALDTSVFDNVNIVCVGGHMSWSVKMKDFHKNVKVYDSDMPVPSETTLKAADAIWIQTNCIGHPEFYRVTDIAKINNIPVHYFASAGHVLCKRQMVKETKKDLEETVK